MAHPVSGPWRTFRTLADAIQDPAFNSRLRPRERLEVARLSTGAFFFFMNVFKDTVRYPRATNMLYYCREGSEILWLD